MGIEQCHGWTCPGCGIHWISVVPLRDCACSCGVRREWKYWNPEQPARKSLSMIVQLKLKLEEAVVVGTPDA